MKRRKKGYYDDIGAECIYPDVLAVGIIMFIICAVIVGLTALLCYSEKANIQAHNTKAQAVNALPHESREIIKEYYDAEGFDEETLLIKEKDPPGYQLKDIIWIEVIVSLAGIVIIMSIATFYCYCRQKRSYYRICDLPFDKLYGWLLFLSMFVCWPIIFASWLGSFPEIQKLRERERTTVKEVAQQEINEEMLYARQQAVRFPKKAERGYINYRVKGRLVACQEYKKTVTNQIAEAKGQLRRLGEGVSDQQKKIGKLQAELQSLEKMDLSEPATRRNAKAEFEAIKVMRGVSSIKYVGKDLEILVKVRVPYKKQLYDFGDYVIRLSGDSFSCKRKRSGVKLDATSNMPTNNDNQPLFYKD